MANQGRQIVRSVLGPKDKPGITGVWTVWCPVCTRNFPVVWWGTLVTADPVKPNQIAAVSIDIELISGKTTSEKMNNQTAINDSRILLNPEQYW